MPFLIMSIKASLLAQSKILGNWCSPDFSILDGQEIVLERPLDGVIFLHLLQRLQWFGKISRAELGLYKKK